MGSVFVACNQHHFDLTLLREAILDMEGKPPSMILNPAYFSEINLSNGCPFQYNLRTTNMRIAFGLKLGVRGVLSYNTAARASKLESMAASYAGFSYSAWAHEFVGGMKQVDYWL